MKVAIKEEPIYESSSLSMSLNPRLRLKSLGQVCFLLDLHNIVDRAWVPLTENFADKDFVNPIAWSTTCSTTCTFQ